MAYLKPPFFVRNIGNKLVMRFGGGGAWTLAVAGRTTGALRAVPVIPFEHDGAQYIVSTRGESEWVRNLRAAGTVELRRKGETQTRRATEVPVDQRGPIIAAYRERAGRSVTTYWKKLPDPADHPTFRLDPA